MIILCMRSEVAARLMSHRVKRFNSEAGPLLECSIFLESTGQREDRTGKPTSVGRHHGRPLGFREAPYGQLWRIASYYPAQHHCLRGTSVPSQVTIARFVQKTQCIWHPDRATWAEQQQRNDSSVLSGNEHAHNHAHAYSHAHAGPEATLSA